jgi:hypothetical protein
MAYTKYSLTPASNTAAPPDGAPEGMLPSAVNDTMRDMMSQIRDCGDGIRNGTYTMTAPVITGGTITGVTDIAVADGGTGASTVAAAQTNLQVFNFKNRIINGDMRIDQRNAGASTTPTGSTYTLDRWVALLSVTSKYSVQQNAGSVTPPVGFVNYLGCTSTSAYSVASGDYFGLRQNIEGLNVGDLGWGTANAKTVTLSFWVRSSLTGTFGGSLTNSAETRSYPFTYTINSANTWELETITIAGDTTGTWLTTNGVGIRVNLGLGVGTTLSGTAGAWAATAYYSATGATSVVGTNGATFYITGVQLEVGSSASNFEVRDYSSELNRCMRYFERIGDGFSGRQNLGVASYGSTTTLYGVRQYQVQKRTGPSSIALNGASGWRTLGENNGLAVTLSISDYSSMELFFIATAGSASFTTGNANLVQTQDGTGSTSSIFINAEL